MTDYRSTIEKCEVSVYSLLINLASTNCVTCDCFFSDRPTIVKATSSALTSNTITNAIEASFASLTSHPILKDFNVKKVFDSSEDPAVVCSILGSSEPDLIIGNGMSNYITMGEGTDLVYGMEGKDVYVIKEGDGMNVIFKHYHSVDTDTILFDAQYDDIELVIESGRFLVLQAYKNRKEYLAIKLICVVNLVKEIDEYYFKPIFDQCFSLNSLFRVKSNDGIMFNLPRNIHSPIVKTPILVDFSKGAPTSGFSKLKNTDIVRYIGSKFDDVIVGNTLDNYIDPGLGNNRMRGYEGSDTYVIRPNYCAQNTIINYATDHHLDILLFLFPFDSITARFDDTNVFLTSTTPGCTSVITLDSYVHNDAFRHLLIKTGDKITFAIPPNRHFAPTALIINKSGAQTGQFIDVSANSQFSEVKTVYGANDYSNHIVGNEQANTIVGGSKDDLLEGLGGDDVLKGGHGDDTLDGGPGDDILVGGPGNDKLMGGDGDDYIAPGLGINSIHGGDGTDTVVFNGDVGVEVYLASHMVSYLYSVPTQEPVYDVENVIGTVFDDILQGDSNDNVLIGNSGDDQLYAGNGYDILEGGNGSDTYSWFSHSMLHFKKIDASIMIIRNYATDGVVDLVDVGSILKNELGFEKSGDDLLVRPIDVNFPLFYDGNFIIIFKDWFHPVKPELYRHMVLRVRQDQFDCDQLVAFGEDAAEREKNNK